MKKLLLFTKQQSNTLYILLVFCLCFNYGWSQNLVLNGTCDDHNAVDANDNADAYDMTPNSTITPGDPSPYQAIWNNNDLEDWLEIFYLGAPGTLDEQPGSTSSGAGGTRGVKLYDDGSPVITGSSRRLYQKVMGLTIGTDYIFSVDSRSEAMGTPSEVYILNTEIADELGINANGGSDASVDASLSISGDFNVDSSVFTTSVLGFTASNTFAVIYVRSPGSVDGNTEVFYDNFSIVAGTLSVDDVLASKIAVYPNPANNFIKIDTKNNLKVSSVEIYSLLGQKVLSQNELINNQIDVTNLSRGMYLLKISADGNSITKKIIKE